MLKEAKKWVQTLEEMLNRLAKLYGKSVEEIDEEFDNWYNAGGAQWDMAGGGLNAIEAFENEYRANRDDEAESEECNKENTGVRNRPWRRRHRRIPRKEPRKEVEEIYKKMREFADRRDYTLSDREIELIIEECEEEGDSILDCSDGMLREIVEDWIADHQV